MRLVRFELNGYQYYGRMEGETVRPLDGDFFDGLGAAGNPLPLHAVKLLAPVEPLNIVAVGRNYKAHAAEFNNPIPEEPMLFSKPFSSIIGTGEKIVIPDWVEGRVDHEAELGVVIAAEAKNVPRHQARDYILGLTCVNDVSARQYQKSDVQFYRGKGFDTFCPIGPWIETDLDFADLAVRAELNGKLVQEARTSEMIFPIDFLIEHITRFMTLLPGDIIATGTPAGVSPMEDGDTIVIEIEGVGRLENRVERGN